MYALLGSFGTNAVGFHNPAGYEYLADKVLELDAINPFGACARAFGVVSFAVD